MNISTLTYALVCTSLLNLTMINLISLRRFPAIFRCLHAKSSVTFRPKLRYRNASVPPHLFTYIYACTFNSKCFSISLSVCLFLPSSFHFSFSSLVHLSTFDRPSSYICPSCLYIHTHIFLISLSRLSLPQQQLPDVAAQVSTIFNGLSSAEIVSPQLNLVWMFVFPFSSFFPIFISSKMRLSMFSETCAHNINTCMYIIKYYVLLCIYISSSCLCQGLLLTPLPFLSIDLSPQLSNGVPRASVVHQQRTTTAAAPILGGP